ncbi:CopD family protein [Methylonatrum kenyense]|uniref:CopD family protein n=1 Tax=Methylonatrum kenyense TaxID=455253 RepID=UPI0020C07FCF|nr:CopD family protein [Methylonatrum kenyense]MCK8515651.1 CopD family protein [Methylonatrum kenyense]
MAWLLALHIIFLLFWAAALLYLPVLLAAAATNRLEFVATPPARQASLHRFVYTHVATPAALLAIISGTAVFLWDRNVELWLILKLAVVSLLVLGHAALGLMILRRESGQGSHGALGPWLFTAFASLLMLVIIWLVLAKPVLDTGAWAV